jgi:hypothetical protein
LTRRLTRRGIRNPRIEVLINLAGPVGESLYGEGYWDESADIFKARELFDGYFPTTHFRDAWVATEKLVKQAAPRIHRVAATLARPPYKFDECAFLAALSGGLRGTGRICDSAQGRIEMDEKPGTPRTAAMLRDRATDLVMALDRAPNPIEACTQALKDAWQRGYTAGTVRTGRRLGVYRLD